MRNMGFLSYLSSITVVGLIFYGSSSSVNCTSISHDVSHKSQNAVHPHYVGGDYSLGSPQIPPGFPPVAVPPVGVSQIVYPARPQQPVGVYPQVLQRPVQPAQAPPGQPVNRQQQTQDQSSSDKCGTCFDDCCCWPIWTSSIVWFLVVFLLCFVAILWTSKLYSKGLYSDSFYHTGGYWLLGTGAGGLVVGSLVGGLIPMCISGALVFGSSLMALSMSICLLGRRGAWLGAIGGLGCGAVVGYFTNTEWIGPTLGIIIGLLIGLILGFAPIARSLKMNDRYIRKGLTKKRLDSRTKSLGDQHEDDNTRFIDDHNDHDDIWDFDRSRAKEPKHHDDFSDGNEPSDTARHSAHSLFRGQTQDATLFSPRGMVGSASSQFKRLSSNRSVTVSPDLDLSQKGKEHPSP